MFSNNLIGPTVAGDSGDDETSGQLNFEEDNNSDESEEHVAALSLLSFAGLGHSSGPGGPKGAIHISLVG